MKFIIRTLIVCMLLIAGLITFILTPAGLRSSVNIVAHYLPGKLTYQKVSGIIIGPIDIDNLEYKTPEQDIQINKLHINWKTLSLFKKIFEITDLTVSGIRVNNKSSKEKQTISADEIKATINHLLHTSLPKLPVDIVLHHFALKHILLMQDQKKTAVLNALTLSYRQKNRQVTASLSVDVSNDSIINSLHFKLNKTLKQTVLDLLVVGKQTDVHIVGTGDSKKIRLRTVKDKLLSGRVNTNGQIDFKTASFDINISAQQILLSLIHQRLPALSTLNLAIKHKTQHFSLDLGATTSAGKVLLQATHHHNWNIDWDINIGSLAQLDKNYTGRFLSKGYIKEHQSYFYSQGFLTASHFKAAQFSLEKSRVKWSLNKKQIFDGKIIGEKITLGSTHIKKIQAAISGTTKKQVIHSAVHFSDNKLKLSIKNEQRPAGWKATITTLSLLHKNKEQWSLKHNADILISNNTLSTVGICLKSTRDSTLCLSSMHTSTKKLSVNLQADLSLSTVNNFIPKTIANISNGRLKSNLTLTGSLEKPALLGMATLSNTNVDIPKAGIKLQNISLNISGENKRLKAKLNTFVKDRPIHIVTETDLSQKNFPTNVSVITDNTPVISTEEYAVSMTSNLHATIDGNNVAISGNIFIPEAKITPYDFHSTESLPENDIVYARNNFNKVTSALNLTSNVDIKLGKKVNINTSGIAATLSGSLRLTGTSEKALFATGQIIVDKGSYSIFGQTLTMEPDSTINYAHSILANPSLNLKASKTIRTVNAMGSDSLIGQDNITVGVEVHGLLKAPELTFYSRPIMMSQTDILSYILLGYAANKAKNTDYLFSIIGALTASGKGPAGKKNIIADLQSGLGLSEMGIESSSTVDSTGNPLSRQSSFVIGKSLGEDFYIRYSVGLANQGDVFQLRYLFHKYWAAQIDSNTTHSDYGFDLLYTIETN